jgi:hypothetical protein
LFFFLSLSWLSFLLFLLSFFCFFGIEGEREKKKKPEFQEKSSTCSFQTLPDDSNGLCFYFRRTSLLLLILGNSGNLKR